VSGIITSTQASDEAVLAEESVEAGEIDYEALVPDPLPPRTDLPIWVALGQPFTYTFTITNVGPVKATDVVFYDALPDAVTLQEIRSDSDQCEGEVEITCRFGDLEPGDSVRVYLVVMPVRDGLITNIGRVGSKEVDPNRDNNKRTKLHIVVPAAQTQDRESEGELEAADIISGGGQPLNLYFPLLLKTNRIE
jgi:uncharacterized repeat protein (TIGR01451 family)